MQVRSLASLSGLRAQHCCGCGIGWQLQLRSTPRLGTSICHWCGLKKKKKKKKENSDLRPLRHYLVQKAFEEIPLVVKELVPPSPPANLSVRAAVIQFASCQLMCLIPTQ